ncbi:MAG: DUF2267 domain-containing protein [Halolamina sp.]
MPHELVAITRHGADFESDEDAAATVEATLRALRSCISRGEATDIAHYLPAKFGKLLTEREGESATPIELATFIGDVAEETGVPEETAEKRIRAVIAALKQTVGEDEIANAEDQLPPEYGRLFEVGPELHAESFSTAVAGETDLGSEEAETATRAVLETFAERITRGEGEDIAHFLDGDAARWVVDRVNDDAEAFDRDAFIDRVADRADVDETTAEAYISAVMRVLDSVVPDRELDAASAQLPADVEDLVTPAV